MCSRKWKGERERKGSVTLKATARYVQLQLKKKKKV